MALHPLAWMLMLHYRDRRDTFSNRILIPLLDAISHGILDVTPKVASSMLTFFLAGFFLFVGLTNESIREKMMIFTTVL
jgi:hypothetical protein